MENEKITRWSYLKVSNQVIKEALDRGDTQAIDEKLIKQGFSETLIFMIRQGYVKQLREDAFMTLSEVLGSDLAVNT